MIKAFGPEYWAREQQGLPNPTRTQHLLMEAAKPSPSILAQRGKNRKRLGFNVVWDLFFFPPQDWWKGVSRDARGELHLPQESKVGTMPKGKVKLSQEGFWGYLSPKGKAHHSNSKKGSGLRAKMKSCVLLKMQSLNFPVTRRIHFWALQFMR